jgi:hypothetical protein
MVQYLERYVFLEEASAKKLSDHQWYRQFHRPLLWNQQHIFKRYRLEQYIPFHTCLAC